MEEKTVHVCWADSGKAEGLNLPEYASEYAAGMDVEAAVEEPFRLRPGERGLFPTNLRLAVPRGYEMQVRPRSGLAVKKGIAIINAPGTIDADYRGEIRIGLVNLGRSEFTICRGDRIAQLVLAPVVRAKLRLAEELDETGRGVGGFGHTGR